MVPSSTCYAVVKKYETIKILTTTKLPTSVSVLTTTRGCQGRPMLTLPWTTLSRQHNRACAEAANIASIVPTVVYKHNTQPWEVTLGRNCEPRGSDVDRIRVW